MSTSKYIRPMSFGETIGTMYRLYVRFMVPILVLNILIAVMSWWVLLVGAFVGPVLMMTSNAILGKSPKVWDSFRRGIISVSFLKIAVVSIVYIVLILIAALLAGALNKEMAAGLPMLIYPYLFLSPLWIFIPMIMLLEKKGLRASIRRSFQILRKDFSRILQMDIFITLFFIVIAFLWALLGGLSADNFAVGSVVALFLTLITGFASMPYVFVYYEYRARYENYTEELLTEELGYQPIEEMLTV